MKRFRIPFLLMWFLWPQAVQPEGSSAWLALFNGRDLSGWQEHGREKWTVEGGEILGEALTREYGYLATTRTYRNFEPQSQVQG